MNVPIQECLYSRPQNNRKETLSSSFTNSSYIFGDNDMIPTQSSPLKPTDLSFRLRSGYPSQGDEENHIKDELITRFKTLNLGDY